MAMRLLLTIFVTLHLGAFVRGQTITRYPRETTEEFVKRLKPDSLEIAHAIIETNTWTKNEKAIVAFFGYDAPDPNTGYNLVTGFIFFPIGDSKYESINLEPIEEEGGLPEVISVFFANADNDLEQELGVLCKYWQHSYEHMGTLYVGFIFDNPANDKKNLTYDRTLSSKFWGCDCDFRERKSEKAKFKTAKNIKDELKRMGF